MTNDEMMQQQINQVADMMKSMFTKEELEDIEKKFNERIKELKDEKGTRDNKSNRKIY